MTTLLDADAHPAIEVILAYHQRWEEEILFDEQKTHHDPVRPGKPAQLRSGTPAGVVQELLALSCWATSSRRPLRVAPRARADGIDPDRLSFTGTLRVLRVPTAGVRFDLDMPAFERWYRNLLWEIPPGEDRAPPESNQPPRGETSGLGTTPKNDPHHRSGPTAP